MSWPWAGVKVLSQWAWCRSGCVVVCGSDQDMVGKRVCWPWRFVGWLDLVGKKMRSAVVGSRLLSGDSVVELLVGATVLVEF